MSNKDMVDALITRAKNLNEYTITTDVPENFRFNGVIPFDMSITEATGLPKD